MQVWQEMTTTPRIIATLWRKTWQLIIKVKQSLSDSKKATSCPPQCLRQLNLLFLKRQASLRKMILRYYSLSKQKLTSKSIKWGKTSLKMEWALGLFKSKAKSKTAVELFLWTWKRRFSQRQELMWKMATMLKKVSITVLQRLTEDLLGSSIKSNMNKCSKEAPLNLPKLTICSFSIKPMHLSQLLGLRGLKMAMRQAWNNLSSLKDMRDHKAPKSKYFQAKATWRS